MSCLKQLWSKEPQKANSKEIKCICSFVWNSFTGLKHLLWILAILSILLYILCRLDRISLECIQETLNDIISFLNARKTAIDGWTYSFYAGLLVYLLTVLFPEAKRRQALLPTICNRVRYIKDTFYDLSIILSGGDWCKNPDLLDNALKQVMKNGKQASEHYSFDYCLPMLNFIVSSIDNYIDMALQFHEVLSSKDIKTLVEVKNSSTLEKVRLDELADAPFDKNGIRKYLEELQQEHIKIDLLYKKLYNQVYKKEFEE